MSAISGESQSILEISPVPEIVERLKETTYKPVLVDFFEDPTANPLVRVTAHPTVNHRLLPYGASVGFRVILRPYNGNVNRVPFAFFAYDEACELEVTEGSGFSPGNGNVRALLLGCMSSAFSMFPDLAGFGFNNRTGQNGFEFQKIIAQKFGVDPYIVQCGLPSLGGFVDGDGHHRYVANPDIDAPYGWFKRSDGEIIIAEYNPHVINPIT